MRIAPGSTSSKRSRRSRTARPGHGRSRNYGPRVLRGDFEPGFKIDHFIKDLGIALTEARRMNLSLPGTALAEQLYVAARAHGLGQQGTHALSLALARLSNERWPQDQR